MGSGAVVWPEVLHFARFGASASFGGSWDRLEVFLTWLPGGFWCWSDLRSRRNNRQCVERKICNSYLHGVGLTPPFVGVSVCGGCWNGRGLFLLGGRGLGACEVWCFMSNSGSGPQIVFISKSDAWSP